MSEECLFDCTVVYVAHEELFENQHLRLATMQCLLIPEGHDRFKERFHSYYRYCRNMTECVPHTPYCCQCRCPILPAASTSLQSEIRPSYFRMSGELSTLILSTDYMTFIIIIYTTI